MSDKNVAALDEKMVEQYLLNHPSFFAMRGHLVEKLVLPDLAQGNVKDLQRWQIERLRNHISKVQNEQDDLQSAFEANWTVLQRIHAAVYLLTGASSFEEFQSLLFNSVPVFLEVDVIRLSSENTDLQGQGTIFPLTPSAAKTLLASQDFQLESDQTGNPVFFGVHAKEVQSQALVHLSSTGEEKDTVLALGSHNPYFYGKDQAPDFLLFFAHIVEQQLQRWLNNK